MVIINQDRDIAILLQKTDNLHGDVIINRGIPIGINLLLNDILLGTFDTQEDFLQELQNINNCTYEYHIISGFSDYDNCYGGAYSEMVNK